MHLNSFTKKFRSACTGQKKLRFHLFPNCDSKLFLGKLTKHNISLISRWMQITFVQNQKPAMHRYSIYSLHICHHGTIDKWRRILIYIYWNGPLSCHSFGPPVQDCRYRTDVSLKAFSIFLQLYLNSKLYPWSQPYYYMKTNNFLNFFF